MPARAADDDILWFFMGDRLEYQTEAETLVWDLQGWAGSDYNRVWFKTEGETDAWEIQALYSRAISPYFDLQFGIRHDVEPSPSRTHAVIGVQGLAPHWFEVDAAMFISDEGVVSADAEVEYDFRITQRLTLQPRLEAEIGFDDDLELGLGSGFREAELSLRLRYEIRRKLAPYLGVGWNWYFGDTKELQRAAGHESGEFFGVAGLRFWF